MAGKSRFSGGFNAIELVILLVIIGAVAAMTVPRMSNGNPGPGSATLAGDLALWRNALDLYQRQHDGHFPSDSSTIVGQLTQFTDRDGNVSDKPDAAHPFGPYLRQIPPLPAIEQTEQLSIPRGSAAVAGIPAGSVPSGITGGDVGWLYDAAGNVYPNTGPLCDAAGKLYIQY